MFTWFNNYSNTTVGSKHVAIAAAWLPVGLLMAFQRVAAAKARGTSIVMACGKSALDLVAPGTVTFTEATFNPAMGFKDGKVMVKEVKEYTDTKVSALSKQIADGFAGIPAAITQIGKDITKDVLEPVDQLATRVAQLDKVLGIETVPAPTAPRILSEEEKVIVAPTASQVIAPVEVK